MLFGLEFQSVQSIVDWLQGSKDMLKGHSAGKLLTLWQPGSRGKGGTRDLKRLLKVNLPAWGHPRQGSTSDHMKLLGGILDLNHNIFLLPSKGSHVFHYPNCICPISKVCQNIEFQHY